MLHNETRKLLEAAFEKTHDSKEVAKYFSVDRSTVYRINERQKREGNVNVKTYLRGRKRALSDKDISDIEQLVREHSDITMAEIVEKLHLHVCPDTVRNALIRLGYTRKKKSLHAAEQDRPRRSGKTQKLERHYIWYKPETHGLS